MINGDVLGENLSNVYIRNIEIKNLNNTEANRSLKIKIDFCIYDYFDSKTPSKFLTNLKTSKRIAILVSKDKQVSDYIKKMSTKLEMYRRLPSYSSEKLELIYATVDEFVSIPNKINKMKGSVEFTTKDQPDNLSIFCCVQKINSGTRKTKIEEGPITVEDIFISKKINQRSHYLLYKGTNKVWPGPVHRHQNSFMVNSFHSRTPHRHLEKKEFFNAKIKDLRKKQFPIMKDALVNSGDKNTMFSEIYFSQNNNDGVSFCFLANLEQMFLKNNNYEKPLKMLDEQTRSRIIDNLRIKQVQLFYNTSNNQYFKKFISSTNANREVYGTFSNDRLFFSDNLIDIQSTYSYFEKYQYQVNGEHLFKGFLKEKDVKQVKVKIIINDPFKEFINSFMSMVKKNKRNLMNLLVQLNKDKFYDKKNEMTTDLFVDTYNRQTFMWLNPIRNYLTMLKMFSEIDFQKEFINNFSLLNPKAVNKNSLNFFISEFNQAQINLQNYFSNIIDKQRQSISRVSSRRGNNNISFIEKSYNLNFIHKAKGISYLDYEDGSLIRTIRASEISSLIQLERSRYSTSFQLSLNLDQEKVNLINNSTKAESYLSPKKVIYKKIILDCNKIQTLTENKIKDFVDKTKIRIDKKAFGSLYVDIITNDNNNLNTSFDYLNNNDLDNIIDEENKDIIRGQISNNVIKKFNNFSKKQNSFESMLARKIESSNEDNLFSNKSLRELELMPIQQKFLLARQYNSESEKVNFISNNKNKIDLLNFSVCRINVLRNFQTNSNNEKILNSSTFTILDRLDLNNLQKPTLCRLEKYVSNDFDVETNTFFDYQIFNQFFILIPDNYQEQTQTVSINDDEVLIRDIQETYNRNMDEIEFLRSSFVRQNVNRSRVKTEAMSRTRSRTTQSNPQLTAQPTGGATQVRTATKIDNINKIRNESKRKEEQRRKKQETLREQKIREERKRQQKEERKARRKQERERKKIQRRKTTTKPRPVTTRTNRTPNQTTTNRRPNQTRANRRPNQTRTNRRPNQTRVTRGGRGSGY